MPIQNPQYFPLLQFMMERHLVHLRRSTGAPPPWTEDQILRKYRFCNVYRELDKVTIWIREHIREPYRDHPNLWFMLAIARQINWPETLQELMDENAWPTRTWDWQRARKVMLARQARGEQVYTGAYMLNAHGTAPTDPKDKAFFTCKLVLDSVWQARKKVIPELSSTLQQAWKSFLPYHGWGPFTSYEVVSDLRFTRYLWNAPDVYTWACAGPGALRGLNRLHGRSLNDKIAEPVREMRRVHDYIYDCWPSNWPRLELREIEHSLCEFDKYERVRLGEGQPRSRYNGG